MSEAGHTERLEVALDGKYRIERKLGEGGMATVYLARDEKHNRNVALKVLKPELAAVVGAERFLAEIETTANLQHPHILPLFDSGEADSFLFYVMPYVEGESLRERLDREHQLPVGEAVQVAKNVAEALDYAHRRGVIHRDIKPANILLQDGKPVVSDFGISLAVGAAGGGRLTETGLSLGTPHYMSPEQATGDLSVGATTDIYALGCVLYETLVGEPPFTGSTPQAILGKIVTGQPRPVSEERASVPAHVEAVIQRALEKVPADRFSCAADVGAALADIHFRHRLRGDQPRRGRKLELVGSAVAVVVALLVGWALGQGGTASSVPPRHFQIRLPQQDLPEGGGWGVQPFAAGPRGVVYVATERFPGLDPGAFSVSQVGELWIRPWGERDAAPLEGTRGAVGAFLSPDGGTVGFFDLLTGSLKRVPFAGGSVTTVADLGPGPFLGGEWTSVGSVVYALPTGIWEISESGGSPRQLTSTEAGNGVLHRQPQRLLDGRGIVFTVTRTGSSAATHEVALWSEDSGIVTLTEGHSPRAMAGGHLVFARTDAPTASGVGSGSLWGLQLGGGSELEGDPLRLVERVAVRDSREGEAAWYSISADGALLYVAAELRNVIDLARIDLSGNFSTVVSVNDPQLPDGALSLAAPSVSPDGGRLAFMAQYPTGNRYRLFVRDLRRGALTAIAPALSIDNAIWTRDGQELIAAEHDGEEWRLVRIRADGTGTAEVLLDGEGQRVTPYDITPDGRLLVFGWQTGEGGFSDLWSLPLDGPSEPSPVLRTEDGEFQATLSPDGRWMAFVSTRAGRWEIHAMRFPGGARTVVSTGATGQAFSPIWRGDQIFFLSEEGMMVAEVDASVELEPEIPRRLFEARVYVCCGPSRPADVSPQGDWLVWIDPHIDGVLQIEVVQNWLGELEAVFED